MLAKAEARDFWVKSCVSLIWLKDVSKETAARILSTFNAMELAAVWEVPEEFRPVLDNLIPPDKLELIQFYVSRNGAGRDFQRLSVIHEQVVEEFMRTKRAAA
jgi:hypothetical protein